MQCNDPTQSAEGPVTEMAVADVYVTPMAWTVLDRIVRVHTGCAEKMPAAIVTVQVPVERAPIAVIHAPLCSDAAEAALQLTMARSVLSLPLVLLLTDPMICG